MQEKSLTLTEQVSLSAKIQDYIQLTKLRLSSLVVFSAAMGYVIATNGNFIWTDFLLLMLGGFLVTGSSNAFNQIIEKDLDKLMTRTVNRPLPTGRMSVSEAMWAAILMGISGVAILWLKMNPLCGVLSLLSLLLYVAVYTPAKRITSFSVLIGAIPGAFPPLLGWVAAKNEVGLEGLVLYSIQFIWQFPHFWAIAWMLHDDYQKAGFKMLPSGTGRTKHSAFQTLVYSICLVPMGFLPHFFQFTGLISTLLIIVCGIFFSVQAYRLYVSCEMKSAQKLMFGSFIYLPVVQIIWMIDKLFQ
ncbi:MAG TPA: heme o synthase [Bacteroidia bacterium]|nr:heme o synthase [Bacteroidia bacterium]